MAKNVQIKIKEGDGYVDIFPRTKKELVVGLQEDLDSKQSSLGFIPENSNNKGKAGGYASLDSNSKIPVSQLPDLAKSQTFVVLDSIARNSINGMIQGDKVYETSTGDSYIYDGKAWQPLARADWENVNLQWNNIVNKPSSDIENIDDAVNKKHLHSNKALLDKIKGNSNNTYDLEQMVTKSELGDSGYGDMTKAIYDTNGNGIVDNAEKVNGHTVGTDVPVNAKFTDTIYSHPTNHPASMITEDSSKRFVSDTEKTKWNSKTKITINKEKPTDDTDIWLQEI